MWDYTIEILKTMCWPDGYMIGILNRKNINSMDRWPTLAYHNEIIVGWAVLDDKKRIHVWVNKEHRRQGIAPRIIAELLSNIPPNKRSSIKVVDSKAKKALLIGQYLVKNHQSRSE